MVVLLAIVTGLFLHGGEHSADAPMGVKPVGGQTERGTRRQQPGSAARGVPRRIP